MEQTTVTKNLDSAGNPVPPVTPLPNVNLEAICDVSALPPEKPLSAGAEPLKVSDVLVSDFDDLAPVPNAVATQKLKEKDSQVAPSPSSPSKNGANGLPEDYQRRLFLFEKRRTICLMILTGLALTVALYVSRPIMVPVVLAVLLALTLRPIVRRMRRLKLPDPVGAGTLIAILFLCMTFVVIQLSTPAKSWVAQIPNTLERVKEKMQDVKKQLNVSSEFSSYLDQIGLPGFAIAQTGELNETPLVPLSEHSKEADELNSLASSANSAESDSSTSSPSTLSNTSTAQTQSVPVGLDLQRSGFAPDLGVLSVTGDFIGKLLLVVGLTFFFLGFGDSMLNNLLKVLNTYSEKKKTVELVYEVEKGIASYLFLVTVVNIGLGVATALAMWMLGVPNAALWGALATGLNFIPVFGGLTTFVIILLVSFLSFDNLLYSLVPPLVFLVLMGIECNLVTPPLLGRSMSLNPIVVFLMLIFWGWIWGIGGAFIAIPLLAACKIGFERFEITKPVATLIGD